MEQNLLRKCENILLEIAIKKYKRKYIYIFHFQKSMYILEKKITHKIIIKFIVLIR